MSMSEKLLPCPFCGGLPAIKEFDDGSGGVFCTKCKFQPLTHATYNRLEDKQRAIEDWNRRPDSWIPVTERLPEEGDTVLMWHKEGFVMLAVNMFDEMDDVTHWMPLPEPPEGGKS